MSKTVSRNGPSIRGSSGIALGIAPGMALGVALGAIAVGWSTPPRRSDPPELRVTPVTPPTPAPARATVLFQENFEDGAYASRGWYDIPRNAFASTTNVEHAPGSTRALELRFVAGQLVPQPVAGGRHAFAETDSVYVAYWLKFADDWVGSGKPYHPHQFHLLTNEDEPYVGPGNTHLTVDIEHSFGVAGGVVVLGIQDSKNIDLTKINQDLSNITESRAVAGCNGTFDTTPSDCYPVGAIHFNGKTWKSADAVFGAAPGANYKGNWHRVEVYVRLNSIRNGKGQADGIAQTWVDGRLVIDRRAVVFRTAAHARMKWNQFVLAPYMGDGSPRTQTMWLDDIVVANALPPGR